MAIPIAMIGWVVLLWWVRAAERCGYRGVRPFSVMVRPGLASMERLASICHWAQDVCVHEPVQCEYQAASALGLGPL